ncbi:enterochelin esterase-like enzyme [Christiangramia gaetbulicola]|uniref:Enterochelin esterase-like enzyme n=1 Tax=Christiangramia gaetbulicola TaxID=703340 RepID=A0A2T6AHY7_9FLAO|nr:alpha/beta hydrolase-fold protein [Christiangramia gaetbulicola]PTX43434.1 enterochelin esterase-like enzyme [Christiangramia gaetbulicola]
MKTLLKIFLIIGLIGSCFSINGQTKDHISSDRLSIVYSGEADLVQFRMFEGLTQDLKQDSISGDFKGILKISNLSEAIFTYDILVYKKDSLNQMIELVPNGKSIKLNQNNAIVEGDKFLWKGKDRNKNYLENKNLNGKISTKKITSKYLLEEREITVYKPEKVNSKIPHIYFTDGSVVKNYAPYIDYLISNNKIKPIKLIGIHSSSSNRHQEYVEGYENNELFKRHQDFFYKEVIDSIENKIENWEGERYLFGLSNGAAFCIHAGLNNPTIFKEIIAFSTSDYISPFAQSINPIKFKFDKYPIFYIGAGKYETSILKDNIEFLETMKNNGIQFNFKEFISGHDYNVWRIEFLNYIEEHFKK